MSINHFMTPIDSDLPLGIVVLEDVDHVFEEPPHEYYSNNYNKKRSHYNMLREKYLFLTNEQIEQAYGDPQYLFKVQLESFFYRFVRDKFRYRNISLITVCEDISRLFGLIKSHSETKVLIE